MKATGPKINAKERVNTPIPVVHIMMVSGKMTRKMGVVSLIGATEQPMMACGRTINGLARGRISMPMETYMLVTGLMIYRMDAVYISFKMAMFMREIMSKENVLEKESSSM